jgi:hypothetical protein
MSERGLSELYGLLGDLARRTAFGQRLSFTSSPAPSIKPTTTSPTSAT